MTKVCSCLFGNQANQIFDIIILAPVEAQLTRVHAQAQSFMKSMTNQNTLTLIVRMNEATKV